MVVSRGSEIELDCPFCNKAKIKVFHKESYMQARTSRISAGAKTKRHLVSDYYEVLENCPNCGKTKKEIQKAIETGETKVLSHEERLENLKKRGLPLVLKSEK